MRIFILSMFLAISTSISIEGQEEFDLSFQKVYLKEEKRSS